MDLAEALYWTRRIKDASSVTELDNIREDLAEERDYCDTQILSLLKDEEAPSPSFPARRNKPATRQFWAHRCYREQRRPTLEISTSDKR